MNRTDRLYALVEELRARAPRLVGSSMLAERFEVSVRTIQRDLLALQEAGVPIWSQPGPGGGYSVNVETTLPPLNLSIEEAVTVATALAATRSMPFPDAGRTVLNKLAGAMATAVKSDASSLANSIRIVPDRGYSVSAYSAEIRKSVLERLAVDLRYCDARGRETQRVVEPAGLVHTNNGWYLVAWCRLRMAPRTFQLRRIQSLTLTSEHVNPPSIDAMLQELPYEFATPVFASIPDSSV